MKKPVVTPAPAPHTLAEQKSDFTAEGSPPPGQVSASMPVKLPARPKVQGRGRS